MRGKVSRAAAAGLQGSQHVLTCHCSAEETSLLPKPQRGINIRQKEPSLVSSVQSDVSVLPLVLRCPEGGQVGMFLERKVGFSPSHIAEVVLRNS